MKGEEGLSQETLGAIQLCLNIGITVPPGEECGRRVSPLAGLPRVSLPVGQLVRRVLTDG